MSKRIVTALAGFLAMPVTAGLAAAQTSDAPAWSIASIKIGDTMAQAKAAIKSEDPQIAINDSQGMLTFKGFMSPPQMFGVKAQVGAPFNALAGSDQFVVANDLESQDAVVAVQRQLTFAPKDQPSLDAMNQALVEKFGKPDLTLAPGSQEHLFVWFRNAAPNFRDARKVEVCNRSATVIMLLAQGNTDQLTNTREPVEKSCGLFLSADFAFGVNKEVYRISYQLIDSDRARRSYDALMKIMTEGSDAAQAKDKALHDQNKPHL